MYIWRRQSDEKRHVGIRGGLADALAFAFSTGRTHRSGLSKDQIHHY